MLAQKERYHDFGCEIYISKLPASSQNGTHAVGLTAVVKQILSSSSHANLLGENDALKKEVCLFLS